MRRLKAEIGQAMGLAAAADGKGELFFRLLRAPTGSGWQLLARSTAQPLSKRAYRLVDVPGALNASVAYAMTQFKPRENNGLVVNLGSGSATILIEHALAYPTAALIALDHSPAMLEAGQRNVAAAELSGRISHLLADARCSPLPAGCADRLYADLPFGHHIGSHAQNLALYPAILREAARLARPSATFILLTHEVKLLHRCLRASCWKPKAEIRINLRGLHPRIFVLTRNSASIE